MNTGTPARIQYRVEHETRTVYERPIALSQQLLHMQPRDFAFQECLSHQLDVNPGSPDTITRVDYFGNSMRLMTITARHRALIVQASSIVALSPRKTLAQIAGSMSWQRLRTLLALSDGADLLEPRHFLYDSPHILSSPELVAYAATSFTAGRPVLEAALDLTHRIYQDFEFDEHATTIATPLSEVIAGRRGVCQDFAHLMIGCLRSLGLACRYVSGYLLTTPPPGHPRLIGADASHAWVSVYCPDYGWVDFDPTNRCLVQDEHITLGWGRDFSDVTPMRGIVLGGGGQELEVKVTVTPLGR